MNLNYRVVSKDAENIRNTAGCKSSFFILFHRKHNGPLCCHLYQNKVDENSTSPEGKRFP